MIEILDHTADIGIRVRTKSLEELFKEAALGLVKIMFSFKRDLFPVEERVTITIEAEDVEELLVTWLNEILYLFESRELAFKDINFMELKLHYLKAELDCFKVKNDEVSCYIKAATYHGLSVKKDEAGFYEATIIFDI